MENVRSCGFVGMVENCVAESAQGGFTDCSKMIRVFPEGDAEGTTKEGREQTKSNKKAVFGEQKKGFKVRRMNAKTGQVDIHTFTNNSVSWYCVNFGLQCVDKAIMDRAVFKNANVTSKHARPVSTLAGELATADGQKFRTIAHDHLRIRYILFYGYDSILKIVVENQPECRLFPWITENIKRLMPKLTSQNICNPRQAGYARLFARTYVGCICFCCFRNDLFIQFYSRWCTLLLLVFNTALMFLPMLLLPK